MQYVTLRLVRVTIFVAEKQKVLNFTNLHLYYCLSYPRSKAHARYCHLLVCFVLPYFPTFSHIRYDFWKKKVAEHKMCVLSLRIWSKTFLILKRIQRDIVINVKMSSCKVPVIHVGF